MTSALRHKSLSLRPASELPERLQELDFRLSHERAGAVDAEELAAYLEADGLSDETLKDRYGVDGLFAAAELLYRQKGTGRSLNRASTNAAPRFPWIMLLRGPLYLLPGLSGALIARTMGAGGDQAFVFAAALSWGWTMLVAGIRYAEPLAVPGNALRLTLLISAAAGSLGGAVCAALLSGPDKALIGALIGGAVALSGTAAGVLLALRRVWPFALAFASPLLAAIFVTALPSPLVSYAALALLALLPSLAALNATRTPGQLAATRAALRPHLPHALYGWAMAAAFIALTQQLGTWALLPLILASGLLEAGVWHTQATLQRAARVCRDLTLLRRSGIKVVITAAAGYGLSLAAALLVLLRLPLPISIPNEATAIVPLYGVALLLSAWLSNHGPIRLLAVFWALSAAALLLGLPPTVFALLPFLLIVPTLKALADPRSYR